MATGIVTIEQFITDNQITIKSTRVDRNPKMEGSANMDNWKVTLARPTHALHAAKGDYCFECSCGNWGLSWEDSVNYEPVTTWEEHADGDTSRSRMTLTFSKGIGHHGAEPEAIEVLDCLASDAAGVENASSFEDWCSEYGYDSDSRKALKTFKACEHEAARLKTFLGDELYQQLLWHTERA